jgi:RHS repeat-associated protein
MIVEAQVGMGNGSQNVNNTNVGYTGHQWDNDTGLNYMQARYYDPLLARFYSNDPLGFRDVHSFNRYAYANNNPYKYIDPDGQSAKTKSGGLKGRMANVAKSACKEACGTLIFYAGPDTQGDYAMRINSRRSALRKAKRDAKVPNAQNPEKVEKVKLKDENQQTIKDLNGNVVKSTEYAHTTTDGKKVIIQDHSAGHQFSDGKGSQGPHFNVRPKENKQTGSVEGTKEHYDFDK